MSQPYIGQITLFAGNFPPIDYAFCNGQSLPISQYTTLFTLIGTTYGGDGVSTFNLPDLRSRVPMHMGTGAGLTPRVIGQSAGSPTVTLTTVEIPSHSHSLNATTAIGTTTKIGNNVLPGTVSGGGFLYETVSTGAPLQMASNACSISGSAIPHDNMMPTLGISFVIALYGVFPQRS